jgi:hypothetical protein
MEGSGVNAESALRQLLHPPLTLSPATSRSKDEMAFGARRRLRSVERPHHLAEVSPRVNHQSPHRVTEGSSCGDPSERPRPAQSARFKGISTDRAGSSKWDVGHDEQHRARSITPAPETIEALHQTLTPYSALCVVTVGR